MDVLVVQRKSMMRSMVVVLLSLCAPSYADVSLHSEGMRAWRVKVTNSADGELVAWPKNQCGNDVEAHVRRIVRKHPYIEVIDDKMAARIDEKRPVPAYRQSIGDTFEAAYDVTDTRTIVFTIRWRDAKPGRTGRDGSVPVAISVIAYDKPGDREAHVAGCRETWVGRGRLI